MAGGRGRRRSGGAGLVLPVLGLLACASPVYVVRDGRLESAALGFRLALPGSGFRPVSIPGAVAGFEGADGTRFTVNATCDRPLARPEILARELRIGLREAELERAAPEAHRGLAGFRQALRLRDGRWLEAVTLTGQGCVYDLLAALPGEDPERLEEFERWWRSFEPIGRTGA